MFANTKESGLEMLIVKWLVEHNCYEEGSNADYNKEYAMRLDCSAFCKIHSRSKWTSWACSSLSRKNANF